MQVTPGPVAALCMLVAFSAERSCPCRDALQLQAVMAAGCCTLQDVLFCLTCKACDGVLPHRALVQLVDPATLTQVLIDHASAVLMRHCVVHGGSAIRLSHQAKLNLYAGGWKDSAPGGAAECSR